MIVAIISVHGDHIVYDFYTMSIIFVVFQVRVGGLIVMDNVLWYGKVADPLVSYLCFFF